MTVWVVTACRGEYSDRNEWVDSVWATESEALTRAVAVKSVRPWGEVYTYVEEFNVGEVKEGT